MREEGREEGGRRGEQISAGQRNSEGGGEREEGGRRGEQISAGEWLRVCAYTCDLAYLLVCIYMYVHVHIRINNEIPI